MHTNKKPSKTANDIGSATKLTNSEDMFTQSKQSTNKIRRDDVVPKFIKDPICTLFAQPLDRKVRVRTHVPVWGR